MSVIFFQLFDNQHLTLLDKCLLLCVVSDLTPKSSPRSVAPATSVVNEISPSPAPAASSGSGSSMLTISAGSLLVGYAVASFF